MAKSNFLVIPGTNIRLYDGDVVKISNRPNQKYIIHYGWFIYSGAQNYGWYFESISTGEVLPSSIVDLTLCTLTTTKTIGSEKYDGKVVNYTRPFTDADSEMLSRAFITVDTVAQRDNLDKKLVMNGKIVRVNDIGIGAPAYYIWNSELNAWEIAEGFGGITEVIGKEDDPAILSTFPTGLYRVRDYYKICPSSETINTNLEHLVFINQGAVTEIKLITETNITNYNVSNNNILVSDPYINQSYADENYKDVFYDTEANWNNKPQLLSKRGAIYVYSDHTTDNNTNIPAIKIGDGTSYLIDMPFTDKKYAAHIADTNIHVTAAEKNHWNNKVTCKMDPVNINTLIITTEDI